MGFIPARHLVLIHLSVLLLSSISVFGDEFGTSWTQLPHHSPIYPPAAAPAPHHHKGHHHHHPKAHPPVQPPVHAPVHPPSHSPVHTPIPRHPPIHAPSPVHPPSRPIPPRKFVAVEGVVYCKSCKYIGVDTLLGATPLLGAVVKLQCNNTKYPIVQQGKTDKNGYFFIMAPKTVTTYGFHKCKVSLVSSPMGTCTKPTNLHFGLKGSILIPSIKPPVPPPHPLHKFQVFSVGPFAFESSAKLPCPR